MKGYLTLKEAQGRFGVKADTLRSYITRGQVIPSWAKEKVGTTWLISLIFLLKKYKYKQHIVEEYLNSKGEWIGYYIVDLEADREVYFKDGSFVDYSNLTVDDQNLLDEYLDDFEDGSKPLIDGYETLERYKFIIKRKIKHIEDFDGNLL